MYHIETNVTLTHLNYGSVGYCSKFSRVLYILAHVKYLLAFKMLVQLIKRCFKYYGDGSENMTRML